ncbi:class I SAM-dependent methyltransferase [Methylobacter sp. S3L5C]|uniref:class I SAM-dependent methyltransferase n=1 Tax=Methylobacter sp. S3L5C TaxID=2839024 RepID=UPI001FAE6AF9|nr:class I SAM-dependent methyltransferase [Methylobacter sp. S3L5C]UOA07593.1 class I SAM-dependent methyltransferase [Methylobacter sp. S3L5C]
MRDITRFAKCVLRGKVYLGSELAALQGPPERHLFFRPTVELVCEMFEGPIRILEIGSWAGASAITWVKAFVAMGRTVTIDCVDQWIPYFDLACETNDHYRLMNEAAASEDIYALFLHNLRAEGILDQVIIRRGSAQDTLPKLNDNTYHLIYIDGSHLYTNVISDIRETKRLILEGGIICGDDLEIQANELSSQALLQSLETGLDYTNCDSSGHFFHPGVTAAVAEELGEVSAWQGYWAIRWVSGMAEKIVLDLAAVNLPAHIQCAIDESPSLRLIENDGKFRIHEFGSRYIAIAIHLDPKQIFESVSFNFDISPVIFIADSIVELNKKLDTILNPEVTVPLVNTHDDTPTIIGSYEGYNLVSFKGQVIGIHQTSGPIDVRLGMPLLIEQLDPERIQTGTNADEVIVGIALRKKLVESETRQAQSNADLQQRLKEVEDRLKHYEDQLEAESNDTPTIIGSYEGYNLVSFKDQVIGIPQTSGPINVRLGMPLLIEQLGPEQIQTGTNADEVIVGIALRKKLGESEIRQAESNADLQQRLKKVEDRLKHYEDQSEAESNDTPTIIGSYEGYNLVSFKGQVIGIHQTSGPIDVRLGMLLLLEQLGPERILTGTNTDEVIVGIALRKKLGESESRQAESNASLQQQIKDAEDTLKRFVEQSETRQAESNASLQQQLKEVEDSLRRYEDQSESRQSESNASLQQQVKDAEDTLKRFVEQSETRQAESSVFLRQKVEESAQQLAVISQSMFGKIILTKKWGQREN